VSLRGHFRAGGLGDGVKNGVLILVSMVRLRLEAGIGLWLVDSGGVWKASMLRLAILGDFAIVNAALVVLMVLVAFLVSEAVIL